jgi:hypothetical protein
MVGMKQMKKLLLLLSLLALIFIAMPTVAAISITADGNLDDWGLGALSGPSSNWELNETWIPTNPGVEFLVTNNNNPLHKGLPGFYASGVHIIGTKNNWKFYDSAPGILKATGQKVNTPWGGEPWNIEALYLTQDSSNIYLAAITSMPQDGLFGNRSGHDDTPADLAMHFKATPGAKYGFEYGLKLGSQKVPGNYNPGDIVYLPDWNGNGYILPVIPDVMKSPALPGGGVVGQAQLAYTSSWINHVDHGSAQYVIETIIPKANVGLGNNVAFSSVGTAVSSNNVGLSNFLLTQNCENDRIFVPEFPTIAVSVGAILGMIFVIYSVRRKDQE